MNQRIAIFPGSFDPPTLGHVELVKRSLGLFDRILISIGTNSSKQSMFPLEQRQHWLEQVFLPFGKAIEIANYGGLTAAFAREKGAKFMIRGLRNALDMEYERSIDHLNKHLEEGVETLYLISSPQTGHISSTLVREIIKHGGKLDGLLPEVIIRDLRAAGH